MPKVEVLSEENAELTEVNLSAKGTGIFQKVFELQAKVGTFRKDKQNSFHKYNYASATSVSEETGRALTELGLIANVRTAIHSVVADTVYAETTLTLIDAETGEQMVFSSIGSGQDKGDKSAMKAATASVKYATIAAVFGATDDDPEADTKTDIRAAGKNAATSIVNAYVQQGSQNAPNLRPVPSGAPKPGAAAAAQGPVEVSEGQLVVTVSIDKVFAPGKTKSGKNGPGTVVDTNGVRYDTFDTGLLDIAKKARDEGKNVNIQYTFNETYKRNSIVEHGLGVFGEVATPPAAIAEGAGEDY